MSKEGDLVKPKITYLALYSQFNNLKLADNKLFTTVPEEKDLTNNWFIFKRRLNQDCINYSDCKYCPYRATLCAALLNGCLNRVSWMLDQ